MTTQEIVNILKGEYTLKSPYHKNKRLPFNILGYSFDEGRPVIVHTFEYKGWVKHDVDTVYSLKTVLEFIMSGLIKRTYPK